MNKENYIKLVENHRQILEKSRNLINHIFDKITEEVQNIDTPDPEEITEISGINSAKIPLSKNKKVTNTRAEKLEELSNTVNKLSAILLKIIAKEQEIALIDFDKLNQPDAENALDTNPITEEEIQMMEQFLSDRKREESNILPRHCEGAKATEAISGD